MERNEIINLIREFLTARYQMVLATNGEFPWVSTLYYTLDNDLNLYFLSDPNSIHGKQMKINREVAIAVADAPQIPSGSKKGVQMSGVVDEISGKNKITYALDMWKKTLGVTSEKYSYEGMVKKLINSKIYKFKPKRIKFFNDEVWKEGKEKIIEFAF